MGKARRSQCRGERLYQAIELAIAVVDEGVIDPVGQRSRIGLGGRGKRAEIAARRAKHVSHPAVGIITAVVCSVSQPEQPQQIERLAGVAVANPENGAALRLEVCGECT